MEGYNLKSLEVVLDHIQKDKYFPNFSFAQEMEENGI